LYAPNLINSKKKIIFSFYLREEKQKQKEKRRETALESAGFMGDSK
jgi:hypothetical protein